MVFQRQNFDVSMLVGIWKVRTFLLRTARKRSKFDSWCIIIDGNDVTHSVFRNHVCLLMNATKIESQARFVREVSNVWPSLNSKQFRFQFPMRLHPSKSNHENAQKNRSPPTNKISTHRFYIISNDTRHHIRNFRLPNQDKSISFRLLGQRIYLQNVSIFYAGCVDPFCPDSVGVNAVFPFDGPVAFWNTIHFDNKAELSIIRSAGRRRDSIDGLVDRYFEYIRR